MLSLGVSAGLLAACSSEVSGPGPGPQPGVLLISGWSGNVPVNAGNADSLQWTRPREAGDYTAPDPLTAPDTVAAGEAFEVMTHTVGPSGCWRSDGQTVTTAGRVVVVRPYDSHSGSEACTEVLLFLAHSATLVLTEPGEWILRVDGRRLRMGDDVWQQPNSAERTLIVR
jgi:hypothetical protein